MYSRQCLWKPWSHLLFQWVHVLSELPSISQFEPVLALWDCVHEFCFECPKVSGYILKFFDEGGLVPSESKQTEILMTAHMCFLSHSGPRPLEYIVPPGPRPQWVCQGSTAWFPPGRVTLIDLQWWRDEDRHVLGWDPKQWRRYIDHAKRGLPRAAKESYSGSIAAAEKLGVSKNETTNLPIKLIYSIWNRFFHSSPIFHHLAFSWMQELGHKLSDARVKLKRIKTRSDLNTQNLRPLWDPSASIAFITATRQITGMPDCRHKDDVEGLTMNDMKYLSRWM